MDYGNIVEKVMALLKEKGVCQSSQKSHRECYTLLEDFLNQKGTEYSELLRDQWFAFLKETFPSQRYTIWIKYVMQLEEMDLSGTISDRHLYLNRSGYEKLPETWKKALDVYLESCKTKYTIRTLEYTRIHCAEGLLLLSDKNVNDISELTYDAIIGLVETKMYCTDETRAVILNNTAHMLKFYGEIGQCSGNLSLLLNEKIYPHIGNLSDFRETGRKAIERVREENRMHDADEFRSSIIPFTEVLKAHGYVGTTLKLAMHALTAFYLFLEIHRLGFHPDIMWRWFDEVRERILGSSWLHWRRVLKFYEEFFHTGDIHPDGKYHYQPTLFEQLPFWCREAIEGFLVQKNGNSGKLEPSEVTGIHASGSAGS